MEYFYTQQLKSLFGTENYYYKPSLACIMERIDESILLGEGDVIGQLSVNASFEFHLMQQISKIAPQILCGETILILPPEYEKLNLGAFSGRWSILSKAEILSLVPHLQHGYLHYIQKNQRFLSENVTAEEAFKCQYAVFSSYTGKIFAKYRNLLPHSFCAQQPFSDKDYIHYINSLVSHSNFNYRDTVKRICINKNLLPQEFFRQPKKWMPSVWQNKEGDTALNRLSQVIIESNEQTQYLLNPDVFKQLVLQKQGAAKEQLLLSLVYFFRFCHLFAVTI